MRLLTERNISQMTNNSYYSARTNSTSA